MPAPVLQGPELKNTPSSEQLQERSRLLSAFYQHPVFFQAYLDVLKVVTGAENTLRTLYQKRYDDAVNASNKLNNAATAAAFTEFRHATRARYDAHRQAQQELRDALNRDIQAANDLYQAAEKVARQGVNERFAAIDLRLSVMNQAAVELCNPDIAARAVLEHQQARNALSAEIQDALAGARALYDLTMAEMHAAFREEGARLDAELSDYLTPHLAHRTSQIEADRARHAQVCSDAYMRRYHSVTALDHLLISEAAKRLEQIEQFMRTGDQTSMMSCFVYSRSIFKEQVAKALAEESNG